MRKTSLRFALGLLILATVFVAARAQLDGDASDPLSISPKSSVVLAHPISGPVTITESGSYVVTTDISVITPPAITVAAPNVILDLNGKSVGTLGFDNGDIVVMSAGSRRLRIKDGRIVGGSACISSSAPTVRLIMDNVTCTDGNYGVRIADASFISITDSVFAPASAAAQVNGDFLLRISGEYRDKARTPATSVAAYRFSGITEGWISRNDFECSAYEGTVLDLHGTGTTRVERDSVAGDDTAVCVGLFSPGVVTDNAIEGCRYALIVETSGNRVVNNSVSSASAVGFGILVNGSDNTVAHNDIQNYMTGMTVDGSNNRVTNNSVLGSWDTGISVSGTANSIDGNQVESTYASFTTGLVFRESSSNNVYKNNLLFGNPGGPVVDYGVDNLDAGGNVW